jgi:hypothetical protein
MSASTIFGLKLFRESVANFTKGKKATDGSNVDVQIPNQLSLFEARKFLDEIGITKKLNEYRRISQVFGAKIKVKANGEIENDGNTAGYRQKSASFY